MSNFYKYGIVLMGALGGSAALSEGREMVQKMEARSAEAEAEFVDRLLGVQRQIIGDQAQEAIQALEDSSPLQKIVPPQTQTKCRALNISTISTLQGVERAVKQGIYAKSVPKIVIPEEALRACDNPEKEEDDELGMAVRANAARLKTCLDQYEILCQENKGRAIYPSETRAQGALLSCEPVVIPIISN